MSGRARRQDPRLSILTLRPPELRHHDMDLDRSPHRDARTPVPTVHISLVVRAPASQLARTGPHAAIEMHLHPGPIGQRQLQHQLSPTDARGRPAGLADSEPRHDDRGVGRRRLLALVSCGGRSRGNGSWRRRAGNRSDATETLGKLVAPKCERRIEKERHPF